MKYEQKYTKQMVLDYLEKAGEVWRRDVQIALGCKDRTATNLLRELMDDGAIVRRNIGTDKKAMWLYSIRGD